LCIRTAPRPPGTCNVPLRRNHPLALTPTGGHGGPPVHSDRPTSTGHVQRVGGDAWSLCWVVWVRRRGASGSARKLCSGRGCGYRAPLFVVAGRYRRLDWGYSRASREWPGRSRTTPTLESLPCSHGQLRATAVVPGNGRAVHERPLREPCIRTIGWPPGSEVAGPARLLCKEGPGNPGPSGLAVQYLLSTSPSALRVAPGHRSRSRPGNSRTWCPARSPEARP